MPGPFMRRGEGDGRTRKATRLRVRRYLAMERDADEPTERPDGVGEPIVHRGLWQRHASPITLLMLGTVLALALAGFAGGQPSPRNESDFGSAALSIKTPAIIRNGEFFETDVIVRAVAPIDEAVLAVDAGLWRDMTINTMIPAPADEEFRDHSFRFSYGPLKAGEALRVKIDGQINPPLFAGTRGGIAIYDGKRLIGRQPLRIEVLP